MRSAFERKSSEIKCHVEEIRRIDIRDLQMRNNGDKYLDCLLCEQFQEQMQQLEEYRKQKEEEMGFIG